MPTIKEWLQRPTNPWLHLSKNGNLVLEQDRRAIEIFNNRPKIKADHRIHLDYLPEPYQGNGDAPVVLLSANPGLDVNEPPPAFRSPLDKLIRSNLCQELMDFPFYHLNPHLGQNGSGHGGHVYWMKRFRQLIAAVDKDENIASNAVARGILCVEFFPYHTKSASRRFPEVPSQAHTRELVLRIIQASKAMIVVIRFWKQWVEAIPELGDYPRLIRLKSPQCAFLTRNNLPDNRFCEIVETLK
jgi:hypothetical protein